MASKSEILKIANRIQAQQTKLPWDPSKILYDDQLKAFNDPTPDRVVCGTRQWGKSTLAAVCAVDAGIHNPKSTISYISFDKEHSAVTLLPDIEGLLEKYDVAAHIADGECRFDNGATIRIYSGLAAEAFKVQSQRSSLLIIDECQDADALEQILTLIGPALMKHRGRILLLGIPARLKYGYWWRCYEGDLADSYGQHRGDFRRNPHLDPEGVRLRYEKAKKDLGESSPEFIRHWKGQTPEIGDSLRCVRYDPAVSSYEGDAPPCLYYSIGVDPGGTVDAEAVVIVGYGNPDGNVYIVDEDVSEKGEGGDFEVTANRVGPMDDKWSPVHRFFDYGSAKKGLPLQYRDRQIMLTPVPFKDPEQEFLRLSQLFQAKRLWVKKGSQVEKDLMFTTWDAKSLAAGKPKQSSSWKQNSLDALRAAMHGCDAYVEPETPKDTRSQWQQQEDAELERLFSGYSSDEPYPDVR